MTPTFPARADQAGRIVLHAALDHARQVFGAELVSACALGSLTHGGFQESVSDVDLALMLCEVTPETPAQMETVKSAVLTGQGTELAGRLSLFWSNWEALAQARRLGRFPHTDRLDLLLHGQLLHGPERRAAMARPTRTELVREGHTSRSINWPRRKTRLYCATLCVFSLCVFSTGERVTPRRPCFFLPASFTPPRRETWPPIRRPRSTSTRRAGASRLNWYGPHCTGEHTGCLTPAVGPALAPGGPDFAA